MWGVRCVRARHRVATTLCSPRRRSAIFIQLLELVLQTYPARPWALITEDLTNHISRETQAALLAWPEVRLKRGSLLVG